MRLLKQSSLTNLLSTTPTEQWLKTWTVVTYWNSRLPMFPSFEIHVGTHTFITVCPWNEWTDSIKSKQCSSTSLPWRMMFHLPNAMNLSQAGHFLKNEELRNAREKDAGQKQLPVHQIIRCMYHLGEFWPIIKQTVTTAYSFHNFNFGGGRQKIAVAIF